MARKKAQDPEASAPASAPTTPAPAPPPADDPGSYTVVARRYRPQRFEDVVGQDHVVQALRNAIRMNRVTHAYLFSGTRGVGKTSVARIFAKCLNCVRGPTEEPCNVCDICQAIAVGQDVDVIEIDGASNNGVEAVRELRQNASLRPSRSRYKVYYIDEVHMLSTGAFNALLKTLEEPPEHVKFFFATTEPNKIPITVLSRCQRYDFATIAPDRIETTLAEICAREQVQADREALQVVARRAGGSMRDAQSLLEQLLSSGHRLLTAEFVHQALGIAPDERVLDLIEALAQHDGGAALRLLDQAAATGVQPVEILNGLLEFLRDVMVLAAGADVALLAAPPGLRPRLQAVAESWPLDTVLAAQQILAEARGRLRGSPHGRLLVELALLRVARLEDLAELSELVKRLDALEAGAPAPAPLKKKPGLSAVSRPAPGPALVPAPAPAQEADGVDSMPNGAASGPLAGHAHAGAADGPLSLDDVLRAWQVFLGKVGVRLGMPLSQVRPTAVDGSNALVIALPGGYNYVADQCDTPEARGKIEAALQGALGRPVSVRFERAREEPQLPPSSSPNPAPAQPADDLASDPLVQKVVELFEARRVLVDAEEDARD